ncbi:MAG: YhjD/YihY/BrkB family envelope integrity protein [Nannocystaceae bacterium]
MASEGQEAGDEAAQSRVQGPAPSRARSRRAPGVLARRWHALRESLFPSVPQQDVHGLRRVWLVIAYTLRRWLVEDRGTGLAASLALQTMLSVVPVAGLLLTGVDLLGEERGAELLEDIARLLIPEPERASRIAQAILELAHNITVERLGVIGFLVTLLIASLLYSTLEKTVNVIWRVHRQRSAIHRFTMFYTLATLGPLVILYSLAQPVFSALGHISLGITPILTSGMAMTVVNRFMPGTTVRWRSAIIGGLSSALLFEIGKRGFASYLTVISSYESVYGSLAILPVFTLWTYASWLIVLLGVEVAYVVQHLSVVAHDGYIHPSARRSPHGEVGAGRIAARLMLAICDHFDRKHCGSTIPQLESRYQIGLARITKILERLEAAGYVLVTAAEEASYIPARPLDQVLVRDILALFEGGDVPGVRSGDPLAELYRRLDVLGAEVLGELDYQQLTAAGRARRGLASSRRRRHEEGAASLSAASLAGASLSASLVDDASDPHVDAVDDELGLDSRRADVEPIP